MPLPGITIDDRSTRDIDDAIWLEPEGAGYRVLVTIADVAKQVVPGSSLDKTARERTATQYFATGNSPMLPRSLSDFTCSLWPGKLRKVLAVEMLLDESLSIQDVKVSKGKLVSKAKLSYDQIPGILADEKNPHHTVITLAKKVSFGLLLRRRANGAMVLYDLATGWVTAEEGHVRKLVKREDTVGYILIQELMILANQALATWASKAGIPIIYRNHQGHVEEEDRQALLRQIEEAANTPLANLEYIRQRTYTMMQRAEYGGTPKGHFGLNLPMYTHFTSPIRRYADLVTHQQIRASLKGEKLPYTETEIEEIAVGITQRLNDEEIRRSEQAKAVAEKKATAAIELRRLDGLIPKEFERVTKVQVRSGEDAHPNFIEAFTRRLEQNNVPVICLTFVLASAPETEGWTFLRAKIIEWLTAHPEVAISISTMAQQTHGWPAIEFNEKSEGADHMKTFQAQAKLMRESDSEPIVGPWCPGSTMKVARQYAMVTHFAILYGISPPVFEPVRSEPPPKKVVKEDLAGKHPVAILGEWCAKQKRGEPVYTFSQSGPPHRPEIQCTVQVEGISRVGKAHSKADAKTLAATSAIGALKIV